MPDLFDQNRSYVLGDPELDLIGDRDKLAQWRHKCVGPAFYRSSTAEPILTHGRMLTA